MKTEKSCQERITKLERRVGILLLGFALLKKEVETIKEQVGDKSG